MNFRSSPHFSGSRNVLGMLSPGIKKYTVLAEKILPSGTKAYQVRVSGKEVWIYGSPQFVLPSAVKTEAGAGILPCEDCNENESKAVRPLKAIVQNIEERASAAELSEAALKMAESLKSKGLICDLRPEQTVLRGVQCKGRLPGYPEPVRIYVPQNYVKNEKNKINIFFHGFEAVADVYQINPGDRNGYGDFGARLAESENNESIMVVPESRSKKVPIKLTQMVNGVATTVDSYQVVELTYQKYFQDGTGNNYEDFLNQIKTATNSQFAATTLAAHSGGYLPLNALLGYPKVASTIRRAALFEGSYNSTVNITNWLNNNPENKMRLSWKTNGTLVQQTKAFIARVQKPDQLQQAPTTGSHMENIQQGGLVDFLRQN